VADSFDMIAKTFFGLEGVLAEELTALGAQDVQQGRRMCSLRGDLGLLYRANVHCRTAVRILKPIHTFTAGGEQELYRGVGQVDWTAYLDADVTLAIDPVVHSPVFSNSLYAAQLAKDAIVDQIRAATGRRPSVDLADPDLRINLHIDHQRVTVYLDSSGDSLHKRGYRQGAGEAPINEVLAAGILRLSVWDGSTPLADFMCGSGTFLIEAALAARSIAPGLIRGQFGYMRWKDFSQAAHESVLAEARRQVRPNISFPIQGSDLDPRMISAAQENARQAGVAENIRWLVENFESVAAPAAAGTLITNPPYDERMKTASIEAVYRRIGDALKQHWAGHTAFIFSGNREAARHIGLRPSGRLRLFNGPIECRLLKFEMFAGQGVAVAKRPADGHDARQAFANRLGRMARHWHRWARRQNVNAYRLYDRDIPEVPLAVDWYAGHVLITEYDRPHGRTQVEHRAWLETLVTLICETLAVPRKSVAVHWQSATSAGRREPKHETERVEVVEGPLLFEARLGPSSETGLQPDRRVLRGKLWNDAPGTRFLNLFARTGTATVAAAAGGAASTVSVEASRSLTAWAKRNLRLNEISGDLHRVVCQDPLEFVAQLNPAAGPQFDLAVVEPPGFDGKRREGVWNVQDGHVDLINRLLACMLPGGQIYLVTTFRRLTLRESLLRGASVREITRQTVPPDFRNKKVHRSWSIVRTDG
jgi:23S rRNA (guanine2445-N2)-methyltransferase / 23S rRNA (guanine2069-N7)-methyltransferase